MLNKFADIFVTDSMSQEYIRYKMVQYGLSSCLSFINNNQLIVPDFIKHNDRDKMNDDYYINEIKNPENLIFNKLINEEREYAIMNAKCMNSECNDSNRRFTAEFDLS